MRTRHLSFVGVVVLSLLAAIGPLATAQSIPNNLTPTNDTGVQPYQTYGGVRENINLSNGNVNLQVPLLTLPGRNGHDLVVNLNYDSKIWQLRHQYISDPAQDLLWWEHEVNVPRIGAAGWRLGVPVLQATLRNITPTSSIRCYMDFVVTLGDGSKHTFANRAACFQIIPLPNPPPPPQGGSCPIGTVGQTPQYNLSGAASKDAAFLLLDTSNAAEVVLHYKDGTRIHFSTSFEQGSGCEAIPYLQIANKMVDTDGNVITIQSSDYLENARVDGLTDTLGRTVTFTYGTNTTITYKDSSGSPATITLAYGNFSNVAPTFSQPAAEVMQPYPTGLLANITLPNNLQYTFEYSNWGELSKIVYPTGGYTRYDYGAFISLWDFRNEYGQSQYSVAGDFREVTARRVCPSPGVSCSSEQKTTYIPTINSTQEHNQYEDVCDADQNRNRSEFFDKREITRWVYQAGCSNGQPVGGTLLRTIQTEYVAAGNFSFTNGYDKIPSRVTTTFNDSGQVSRVEYDYDSWSYGTVIDNPIEVREYDYGAGAPGPLVRKTVNTWLKVNPVNGQNYWSASIYTVDRKASEKVYDGAGALKARTDFEYDSYTESLTASSAVQHESSFGPGYTTRGNLTAVTRYTNAAAGTGPVTTRNQYDDAGNTRKTTDPGGHATTFSYTESWAQATCAAGTAKAYLTSTTNALGHVATSAYNSCSGTVASTTDPNTRTTYLTYDVMGRLTQTNLPDGGQTSRAYNESYPVLAGGLSVTTTSKITTSMNAVSTVVVDGLGRITQTQLNSDPEGPVFTDTVYDALGRKKTVTNPYRSTGDSTYGITEFQYDALGRVAKVIPPDGTQSTNNVSTAYSGNCTTVTDQAGKQRKSCSDALGRLTTVYEPDSSGALTLQTNYTYDVLDNLLTVVQSGSRNRTFVYNSLSQLTSATNPESGTATYGYDADGNLTSKTDARSITTTYNYDALHRLATKFWSNEPTGEQIFYDVSSIWGVTVQNPIGRPIAVVRFYPTALVGSIYSYDAMGRVKFDLQMNQFQQPNIYNNQTFNYAYNLDGSVASVTYPSGRVVTYTPNTAGRMLSAVDVANGVSYATQALYAPHGAMASVKYGASGSFTGITETNSYNKRLQPSILSAATSTNTVLSFSYNFDLGVANNGNVKQIVNNLNNNRTQSFTYDELNRIKTAQTQATTGSLCWGQTFSYDIWANLLSIGGVTGYGSCTQQLLSVTVNGNNQIDDNRYDEAGNMTNAAGMGTFTYDAENRMLTAGGVTYTYNAQSQRVMKSSGTLYWHGLGGEVLLETNNSGGNPTEYIFFNGQRIARRDPSGVVSYFFSDHLGSSRIVTNSSGTIVEDSDFYPFGGERVVVDSLNNNYKFTGQERDGESGLDFFGARYYASNLGRFLSPDWSVIPTPVPYADFGNPQSLNLYTYVENNPLAKNDPDGHEECFANGACNALRNPLPNTTSWGGVIVNAAANTVSDLLSLDEVAKGTVDMVDAETTAGKIGTGVGLGLLIGLNVFTGGEEGATLKGAEVGAEEAAKLGGRLGSAETRALDKAVAKGLEEEGYKVTRGAGRPQEYIPGPGGARKGSSYPDITAVKDGKTVRVNTVDTLKDGRTLTAREQRATNKIKAAKPDDEFRMVPKGKK